MASETVGKTLITGITGGVGGALARRLISDGRPVVGLVRPEADLGPLQELGVECIEGDVTDLASLETAMRGCKFVIHAAGLVPGREASEQSFRAVNAGGTRNVVSAAISTGIERLVHVSSVNVLPIRPGETVAEDAPPPEFPHAGYDESKLEAEQAVLSASKDRLDAVVVLPAVIFGPGMGASGRIIRAFVRGRLPFVPLPGRRMSMVYVDDVALGCLLALDKGARGRRYILSNPPVTISDFIDQLAEVTGRRRPRLSLPSWLAAMAVGAAWAVRPITRWRPPVTVTGVRRGGTLYDGSLSEQELGLTYTDLRDALAATVDGILRNEP